MADEEEVLTPEQQTDLEDNVLTPAYHNGGSVGTDSDAWLVANGFQAMPTSLVTEINDWRNQMPADNYPEASLFKEFLKWVVRKIIEWLKSLLP